MRPGTLEAIARFQKSRRLLPDGHLTPATLAVLGFKTGVLPAG